MKNLPNITGANACYAGQFSLRVSGWRESPAAWLSSWSFADDKCMNTIRLEPPPIRIEGIVSLS
jgi:hypothetical protein